MQISACLADIFVWMTFRHLKLNLGKTGLHYTPAYTPLSTCHLVQVLVLSCLDYCNCRLAGFPACAIKLFQLVQNALARLSQVSSCHPTFHRPPLAA